MKGTRTPSTLGADTHALPHLQINSQPILIFFDKHHPLELGKLKAMSGMAVVSAPASPPLLVGGPLGGPLPEGPAPGPVSGTLGELLILIRDGFAWKPVSLMETCVGTTVTREGAISPPNATPGAAEGAMSSSAGLRRSPVAVNAAQAQSLYRHKEC